MFSSQQTKSQDRWPGRKNLVFKNGWHYSEESEMVLQKLLVRKEKTEMKLVGRTGQQRAFADGGHLLCFSAPKGLISGLWNLLILLMAFSGAVQAEEGRVVPVVKSGQAEKYNAQASRLCNQGDYQKALTLFSRSLKIAPRNGSTYLARSICRFTSADYDGALTDCNKGMELMQMKLKGDARATMFNLRAMIYLRKGDFRKGLKDANRALALARKQDSKSDIYDTRGHINLGLKNLWKALDDFNKGLAINPNLIPSYWGRGQVYERLGMLAKALDDYRTATSLDTKNLGENREAQEKARARLDHLTRNGPSCQRDRCTDL